MVLNLYPCTYIDMCMYTGILPHKETLKQVNFSEIDKSLQNHQNLTHQLTDNTCNTIPVSLPIQKSQ